MFDLGGVIVPLDFARAYARMGSRCHLPPGEIRRRISSTGAVELFETGRIAAESFIQEICAALNLRLSHEEFSELWGSIFPPRTLIPERLLESLRRRYRLLLLSNTNVLHFSYIRRNYPLMKHFDDFVLSYEVGVLKPEPGIYQAAVARAGCRPQECFFTDDVRENVDGARRQGMQATQFFSLESLQQDLRDHAIEFCSE